MEALEIRVLYGERETDDKGVTTWPKILGNKATIIQSSTDMEFSKLGLEAIYHLQEMLVTIEADILYGKYGADWEKYKTIIK